ncbi:hypothetical protein CsatB_008007 [Cannabis sativa]|uniref:uncharacterized protein LOC115723996 n=1 Tax=Cannabis sativa TaxID=3483 RepID=UPI0011DF7EC2|nr:uncharacterized protein LOC115723996 [Cannabis sativa]
MGFRSLHDYNLSLLGKQGWRLLLNDHTLVGRVYKARYYLQGNFLTSSLGSNPSFIWKSIFESQDLIKTCARIRIGSGLDTNVLNTPWLPSDTSPRVESDHPSLHSCKVYQLMKTDVKEWDSEVLYDLFNSREAQIILQIPLNSNSIEDVWYWSKEPTGFYSVKSAYKHLQVIKGNWSMDDNSNLWKNFWKIKVPPKVLHFAWRVLTDCLATRVQLQIKRVPVQNHYLFCNSAAETTLHLFLDCPFSKSCWNISAVTIPRPFDCYQLS